MGRCRPQTGDCKPDSKQQYVRVNTLSEIEKHCEALALSVAGLREVLSSAKAERDVFVLHLWRSRKAFRNAVETDHKSGKKQEFALRDSFLKAQKLGFKGGIRAWEDVLTADLFREGSKDLS